MKLILIGYPGSQSLVPFTRYLLEKYLPDFDLIFLNHTGPKEEWSKFLWDKLYFCLSSMEPFIFALDDYLIRDYPKGLDEALATDADCVKLCATTEQEHLEYPVTTQYCMWRNRKVISDLLEKTTTPWDFEITGSKLFTGTSVVKTCLDYDVHSALSSRWSGVKLDGLKYEDLKIHHE